MSPQPSFDFSLDAIVLLTNAASVEPNSYTSQTLRVTTSVGSQRYWRNAAQYGRMDEPDFEEAENQILTGIEPDDKNNVKWHLACVYTLYAELFKQKGDPLKTREKHEKAIYVFKACGANGWAKKYEKILTEI